MNQYFNVISNDIIKLALTDYESRKTYDTETMNKTDPGNSLNLFNSIIKKLVNGNLTYKSGNFYKHSVSYLPHTDYKINQNNILNVVIPLWYTGERARLIVFDQQWHKDSVTWCLNGPVHKFKINTGIKGNPYEYEDVLFKTNNSIDNTLYENHLSHFPKKCYHGLTGRGFQFEPGSVIIFDSRNIHCTSKFVGEKLGISLRYSI